MKRLKTRLKAKEGWRDAAGLAKAGRQHYFVRCRSLCGNKVYLGADLNVSIDPQRSQCHTCTKALAARQRRPRRT